MKIDFLKQYFLELKVIMEANKEKLIELDSVVGDGDLGLTMSDGFAAANEAAQAFEESDVGLLLYRAGKQMANAVPSTMGTLMASGWMQAGKRLKGTAELSRDELILIFEAYEEGVMLRGKAKLLDKTFLDGLHPAIVALKDNVGARFKDWANSAVIAAELGYKATGTMMAVHGRAAARGEASITLLDPGAYVAVLMMQAFTNLCNEYFNE